MERVSHDFAERLCTDYTSLMPTQVSSYRNCLNAFLGDVQSQSEYVVDFSARIGKDGHLHNVGNEDSNEEYEG